MSLDEKFLKACTNVREFTKRPPDNEMLEIYALYKQATVGNCNTVKPQETLSKSKWEAWNAKKGLNSNTAKQQYIGKVDAIAPTYA